MRLISSRESFARFAVPYGPDAIAFAASTSRHDLEPTPDYESHAPAPGAGTASRSSPLVPVATSPVDAPQASSDSSPVQSLSETPSNNIEEDVKADSRDLSASTLNDVPSSIVEAEPSPLSVQAPLVAEPLSQDDAAAPPHITLTISAPATPIAPLPPSSFKH